MLGKLQRVLEKTPKCTQIMTTRCQLCAGRGCNDCITQALENRREILNFIDAALGAHSVDPEARLRMVDAAEDVLDGRTTVHQLRTAIAQRMLAELMESVSFLLPEMNAMRLGSDDDWSRMFVLLQDMRDLFVRARGPATLVHADFGRLCEAMDRVLVLDEPEEWVSLRVSERPCAMRALRQRVAYVLNAADVGFLGEWGQMRVQLVVDALV